MKKTAPPYVAYSSSSILKADAFLQLPASERHAVEIVSKVLPFKANSYVMDELIDWDNYKNDPLYTLIFPQREMLSDDHFSRMEQLIKRNASSAEIADEVQRIRLDLNPHPSAQLRNIPQVNGQALPGVQHKYRETVLFFPSQGQTCHAYCTFCFRWPQFVGMTDIKFATREIQTFVEYLKAHKEVTDVLFTGGDPLIMKTSILENYIDALLSDDLSHIRTIRIGTKALSYWPYRFTHDADADDLRRLFDRVVKSGRNLFIMAHFNHYRELEPQAQRDAARAILDTGAQIRTQSPVLRHINDDPNVWSTMWREQVDQNMIPYYMFVERDTGPKQFFEIPLERAWDIFRESYQRVSGICRTVRGPVMSAAPGKVQVLGVTEVAGERVFTLRFLQGRNPDWVARPFFAKHDESATWLDQLVPAFGDQKFFYLDELNSILGRDSAHDDSITFE